MEVVNAILNDGDGGNVQSEFILESEVGWEQVANNPYLHRTQGVTQHEYLKTLLPKLTGQAKKHMKQYLLEWDWKRQTNPNLAAAKERELARSVWRTFYKQRAVHDILATSVAKPSATPERPDELTENPVLEPPDLEDYFNSMKSQFRMASSNF